MELTNKGTGAGGKNTNYYGKRFEEKTSSENFLINNGFIRKEYPSSTTKYNYYLYKIYETLQRTLTRSIKTLMAMIQPILLLCCACFIIIVVLGFLAPIYSNLVGMSMGIIK